MRAVRLLHVSISSCAWHFQSCGDSALQSSPFAIQYRFFLLIPGLCIHICSATTINIQFEFSIRENGLTHTRAFGYCQKITPAFMVSNRKSNINAIKQWRYCSIAICKWNWNLYVVLLPLILCERMRASGRMKRQNSRLSKMKTHK